MWLQAFWARDANLIIDLVGDGDGTKQGLQPGAPWEEIE